MAGTDRPMNDFALVQDAEYVYGELANGSQVKLRKSDLANVVLNQINLSVNNIRKTVTLNLNDIVDFGVKGGLIVISTLSLQEQCVVLFSCYGNGDSAAKIISTGNSAFINGNRNMEITNKLLVFREDATNRCYLKNTFNTSIAISYQVVAGFW